MTHSTNFKLTNISLGDSWLLSCLPSKQPVRQPNIYEKSKFTTTTKSTCNLRLKVTYFAFEDVGCIEVMGCVKKLSQTVPTGKDLEY